MADGYTSARRKRLWGRISTVSVKTTGEAAIILDVGRKVGDWEAALIELESRQMIAASGDWVVEDNCVGAVIAAHCDAVKRLVLGV